MEKEENNLDKKVKINFFIRLLLYLKPNWAMRLLAKKQGIKNVIFEKIHEIFRNSKRIDIFPTASNERGFILIIDQQTAIYFYQDGDHFEYDGFEMGEYEKGEVTIFDNVRNKINPIK